MTSENTNANYSQRVMIASCIGLLEQYKTAANLSLIVSGSAIILLLLGGVVKLIDSYWFFALSAVIALGVAQTIYAIRVGFDIKLLEQVMRFEGDTDSALSAMDQSLIRLGLIVSAKAGRPLAQRLLSCVGLFKRQLGLCMAQLAVVLLCAAVQLLLFGTE